jgi:hypothetical protein
MFPAILKELSSRDVKYLDVIYTRARLVVSHPADNRPLTGAEFSKNDLLKFFSEAGLSHFPDLTHITQKEADDNRDALDTDNRNVGLSLDVLTRNRLIEENYRTKIDEHTDFATGAWNLTGVEVIGIFSLTDLGIAFVQACTAPKPTTD